MPFVEDVRVVLEHPSLLLESPENTAHLKALYSLVFEEIPTYEELGFGTAKFSLFMRLSSQFESVESMYVHLRQLGWNHMEEIILSWKKDAPLLRALFSTMSPKS